MPYAIPTSPALLGSHAPLGVAAGGAFYVPNNQCNLGDEWSNGTDDQCHTLNFNGTCQMKWGFLLSGAHHWGSGADYGPWSGGSPFANGGSNRTFLATTQDLPQSMVELRLRPASGSYNTSLSTASFGRQAQNPIWNINPGCCNWPPGLNFSDAGLRETLHSRLPSQSLGGQRPNPPKKIKFM
jgi:hypothetical protein